uniref:Uncharacterized protein n=1 Tax=Anguilla anguilla TaxID=7936 RepID=A0A0E9VZI1_ANGAN
MDQRSPAPQTGNSHGARSHTRHEGGQAGSLRSGAVRNSELDVDYAT